ncbi:putative C6 transcription factor [Xylariales sp. PMI_506]|nr:putative C6 transcription factor [Xylariales sp. PMI_506]
MRPLRPLRLLRPVQPGAPQAPGSIANTAPDGKVPTRAKPTSAACEACQKAKTKGQVTLYKDLFKLLRDLPSQDAATIMQRIRSGADASSLVKHVAAGNLLLQLSLEPETRMRYEFPYMAEMPASLLSDNPYLDSLIYEGVLLYSDHHPQETSSERTSSLLQKFGPSQYQDLYLKPIHAAELIDPRLSSVKPSMWTSVCSDDDLMRNLMAVLFRNEFSFAVPFQKDYFLEDMAAQRGGFCSPLLVNTVLAYACCCYSRFQDRAEYWNPHTLVYHFQAESRRLWDLQATGPPLITTLQAAIVLNLIRNMSSLDKLGRPFGVQAVTLAHELRLYDEPRADQSQRTRDGWAFTAWTLYNFESLVAYHFMHLPLLREPPNPPLPNPATDNEWYGNFWLKYPLADSLSPIYFGHFFKARCQLGVLMNEISCTVFDVTEITLDQADVFYTRLRYWYESLPSCVKPKFIVHPAHFQLHIHYQNLLMTLYEPFVASVGTQRALDPRKIATDASKHLQTLLRVYYLRHGFEAMDFFLCQPLMLAGFRSLNAIENQGDDDELEATRSTLFLMAKGLRDQSHNYHLAGTLFRVVKGRMRPEEVSLMKGISSFASDAEFGKDQLRQAVRSDWPVTIICKSDNLEANRLTKLVEQFAGASLEDNLEPYTSL